MTNVRNIRLTDENDAFLVEHAGDNITAYVNAMLDAIRIGQLVPANPEHKQPTKEELQRQLLAVQLQIKTQIASLHDIEIQTRSADLVLKQLRVEKLRRELQQTMPASTGQQPTTAATSPSPPPQQPQRRVFDCINGCGQKLYWPAKATKDNPKMRPLEDATGLVHHCPMWKPKAEAQKKEKEALALGKVTCQTCKERFNADDYANLERDFLQHLHEAHNRAVTPDEITQLRVAQEVLTE
jgi:hypothetical protein